MGLDQTVVLTALGKITLLPDSNGIPSFGYSDSVLRGCPALLLIEIQLVEICPFENIAIEIKENHKIINMYHSALNQNPKDE
jgi:hypothetical protein